MTAKRRIRYAAGSLLGSVRRFRVTPGSAYAFRILTLHHVARHQFPILEQLLDFLIARHRLITPAEAEEMQNGREASSAGDSRVPYLLTFDDGFRSNYEVAASILGPRRISALFFVCPSVIDAPPEQQRRLTTEYVLDGTMSNDSIDDQMALMNWSELRSLHGDGHTIGSHTLSHRRLSLLSREDLVAEIAGSAEALKDRIGVPVRWFAYPFGTSDSITAEAYEIVSRTYRFCCSAVRGINDRGSSLALFRENVELEAPLPYQTFVVEGGLDFYYASRRRKLVSMLPRS